MVCPLSVLGICIGTVLYIQSGGVPGRWMDAHHSKNVYFTETTLEYIETSPESAWAKWILRDGGNGKVMLESLRYRGYYLDAHHTYNVKITRSDTPSTETWSRWTMTKDSYNNYYFEPVRYPGRYLENHSGWSSYYAYLHLGRSGNSVKMRVHQC